MVGGEGGLVASTLSEHVSIIIPTYKERGNVDPLMREFSHLRNHWPFPFEIVLIDDNSPDGTGLVARDLAAHYDLPVRVVIRRGRRSLGRAIAEGIDQCTGEIVCVMDADLSHPPRRIPGLVAAVDGVDGIIASRYAEGGTILRWPLRRRMLSLGATALARLLLRIPYRDPLSGFFLFRRSCLSGVAISGLGNKPLLEILTEKPLAIREVPYEFQDRRNGESKLGAAEIVAFVRLVARLRKTRRGMMANGIAGSAVGSMADRQP